MPMMTAPHRTGKDIARFEDTPTAKAIAAEAAEQVYIERKIVAERLATAGEAALRDAKKHDRILAGHEKRVREASAEMQAAYSALRKGNCAKANVMQGHDRDRATLARELADSVPSEVHDLTVTLSPLSPYQKHANESQEQAEKRNDRIQAALLRLRAMEMEATSPDELATALADIRASVPWAFENTT